MFERKHYQSHIRIKKNFFILYVIKKYLHFSFFPPMHLNEYPQQSIACLEVRTAKTD